MTRAENYVTLEFLSRSSNEGFARVAAAGFAAPVFGEDYTLIPVEGDVPMGAELAVRIQGDSMTPYIADGSIVYVNHDPLQNGDVGIFCVDGDMLCKQYCRDASSEQEPPPLRKLPRYR